MLFFDHKVRFRALLWEEGLIPVPLELLINTVALRMSALCDFPRSLRSCSVLLHKTVIAIHFLNL